MSTNINVSENANRTLIRHLLKGRFREARSLILGPEFRQLPAEIQQIAKRWIGLGRSDTAGKRAIYRWLAAIEESRPD